MTGSTLARPTRLPLETFARLTRLHPEQLRRLVALGVLDAEELSGGRLVFAIEQIAVVARLQRLRAGLGLDYVAASVVSELLARIDRLEAALRAASRANDRRPTWTRTV